MSSRKNLKDKSEVFEYVVFKIIEWYSGIMHTDGNEDFNDTNSLNKLKIIKLHFFVSAINSKENEILNIFNRFYAMPYGHVESDIYEKLSELKRFEISSYKTIIKKDYLQNLQNSFNDLDPKIKENVDKAISDLRNQNSDLINYTAFDLVELSHSYFSWKTIFNLAQSKGKYSELIPSSLIIQEPKYFSLGYEY